MYCTHNPERQQDPSVLEMARQLHQRGWCIIPIKLGTKKPPRGFRWSRYQSERPDEVRLKTWFRDRQDRGLAVIHGEVSGGLVCRDFDEMDSYDRWAQTHSELAATLPTVATAKGRRVYFRGREQYANLPDGELIGDRKLYSVLPPSRHPDGPFYRWVIPLPDGPLPFVDDVRAVGLLPADVTQKAQKAQKAQEGAGSPRKSQVVGGSEVGKLAPSLRSAIEKAVELTVPPGPGTRRAKLFELARRLRAIPEFADIPATEIGFLKPYLKRWWEQAKPKTSGTHPRFEQSWQDFIFGWEEARIPFGATMQEILEKARSAPPPGKAVKRYGPGSLRTLLASLCRELQRFHGDSCFYLSGRAAAPLLGVSDVQAWRWLNTLEQDGIIETVKKHPRGSRLATEYRYAAD